MATRRRLDDPFGDTSTDPSAGSGFQPPPVQRNPNPATGGTTNPYMDDPSYDPMHDSYMWDAGGKQVFKSSTGKNYTPGEQNGYWTAWGGDPNALYRLNPNSYKPTDSHDYLGNLLQSGGDRGNGGMAGKDAASYFDQLFGRKTGNEAVYYGPEAHGGVETIGLPEGYFAHEGDKWNWHDRVPEGPSRTGSTGTGSGPTQSSVNITQSMAPAQQSFDDMMGELKKLFPNGAFNQDVVDRRTENAATNLRRFQKSQSLNDRAALAARGIGSEGPGHESGADITAQDRLQSNIADQYSNAVSGIYADESQNADRRMMGALQTAAGLTSEKARSLLDTLGMQSGNDLGWGHLGLDRDLGMGNLDLSRMLGTGNLALGNARLGLDQQQIQWVMQHGDTEQQIELLRLLYGGANTSAGGHVG